MAQKRAILVLLKILPSFSSNTRTYEIPCTLKFSFFLLLPSPYSLAYSFSYSCRVFTDTLWTPERKGPQCFQWVVLLPLAEAHPREHRVCFSRTDFQVQSPQPACRLQASLYIIERRAFRGGRWALRVKTMHVKISHPSPKHSRGSSRSKAGQHLL